MGGGCLPRASASGEKLPLDDVAWGHTESSGQTPGKDEPFCLQQLGFGLARDWGSAVLRRGE